MGAQLGHSTIPPKRETGLELGAVVIPGEATSGRVINFHWYTAFRP